MKSMLIAFFACLQLFSTGLALPACADHDLFITGDNKIEVFVNGVRATSLANADNWRKSDAVKVPASARVVAVRAYDRGIVGGIIASGPDYVTDRSWKCTAAYTQGWEAASFDDSGWPAATVVGRHGVFPWGKIDGIDNGASWIWTRKYVGLFSDNVVYCRKTLPPCDSCPETGTGPACITSCVGRPDGDYQSCKGCSVFATCANEILIDDRLCAVTDPPLVWDDTKKICDWESTTCTPKRC